MAFLKTCQFLIVSILVVEARQIHNPLWLSHTDYTHSQVNKATSRFITLIVDPFPQICNNLLCTQFPASDLATSNGLFKPLSRFSSDNAGCPTRHRSYETFFHAKSFDL